MNESMKISNIFFICSWNFEIIMKYLIKQGNYWKVVIFFFFFLFYLEKMLWCKKKFRKTFNECKVNFMELNFKWLNKKIQKINSSIFYIRSIGKIFQQVNKWVNGQSIRMEIGKKY